MITHNISCPKIDGFTEVPAHATPKSGTGNIDIVRTIGRSIIQGIGAVFRNTPQKQEIAEQKYKTGFYPTDRIAKVRYKIFKETGFLARHSRIPELGIHSTPAKEWEPTAAANKRILNGQAS